MPMMSSGDGESDKSTFLLSGYARLAQDVLQQAICKRVGVVLLVDDGGSSWDAPRRSSWTWRATSFRAC
ncbi:MAG: hypothetical protein WC709_02510 [Thermoleophilia bacterium]